MNRWIRLATEDLSVPDGYSSILHMQLKLPLLLPFLMRLLIFQAFFSGGFSGRRLIFDQCRLFPIFIDDYLKLL